MTVMAFALVAMPQQAVAAGNGYLEALKAEATSDISQPESAESEPEAGMEGRPTPRTDDQPQMEAWLHANYIGSYTFYQRLSDTKKRAVYRIYRSGADITEIRDKINELLKQ